MDVKKKKIGPEYVDLNDWRSMVQLFVHLARVGHTYEPGHKLLKARVEKRFGKLKHLLAAPAEVGTGRKRTPAHQSRSR
jgi:hypothetical protein